ncbi:MAG: CvpA family protein [Eubacterium sp.]|nr:CvpA family protein [Eubacterium sp.]
MNIIDIVLIAVAIIIIISGYFRGFLMAILSLARSILGIPICYFVAKNCSEPLYNALLRETINAQVSQSVESTGLDGAVEGIREIVNNLPEALKNITDLSFLNNVSAEAASQGIMQNVVDPIAILSGKIVLFIVIAVVFFIVTGILLAIIDKASKKDNAPFKNTNRFLGAALGAVKALIVLIAVAAVGNFFVTYFAGSGDFIDQIDSSAVINFINKFNPLLMI